MRAQSSRLSHPASQRGASLLEVLIAVLILAIGMLGMAALQAVSLRNTQSASDRTTAVIQSYAMLDMMRANRVQARAGAYNQGFLCTPPEDPSNRVDGDVARWITQMQEAMGPTACGAISCAATACTIEVRWDDSRASGTDEDTEEAQATKILTTETRL